MHHHLYPVEDTYITNLTGYGNKNFGINEILRIGTSNQSVKTLRSTRPYSYTAVVWSNYCVTDFTGTLTGSFTGSADVALGVVVASASFSSSYFSGSVDGAAIAETSGSVSGSISGSITGSLFAYALPNFSGELTGSTGRITGTATGTDTRNENWWQTTTTKFVDRSFMKFNLDAISASISNGDISAPEFKLNLKVCNEYELPISYTIYAFPISQSWIMGNGYYSDGGSDTGASWYYRDKTSGSLWYAPVTTSLRPVVDFLTNSANATASFAYGGGTWYYTDSNTSASAASQSFVYESSDISMDVTDIVLAWISGTLPNNGFILMSSDETVATGSGFELTFYSKDTNSINSPYLDIMWEDWSWTTGSIGTSSVSITASSGINTTVQTGSTFTLSGGINGTFSSSVYFLTNVLYVTSSGQSTVGLLYFFTGSVSGSVEGTASYVSGTLSGSGLFTASYFSGSIEGVDYEISDTGVSSSNINGILSGSLETTGSIDAFIGQITSSTITISGGITGSYLDVFNYYVSGILSGVGLSGNISGFPIVGPFSGSLTITQSTVTGPCGATFDAQIVSASFTGGVWSGVMFSGFYVDGKFENAHMTGSWPVGALLGSTVGIPLPSGIDPYAYAHVSGTFLSGKAFGTYQVTRSIEDSSGSVVWDSASFTGQFIDGPLVGGYLGLQLSGSVYTSSYVYTSSMETTASTFTSLDINRAFTVIIKDLQPEYKGGDVARIKVFGRRDIPLKTFERTAQQSGYVIPELLPSSSYYAIKDNMSEEIIVNFDNYTRVSCEHPDGNFFILDTTGLAQERSYRILIRVEESSSKYTFDNGNVFKITR